MPILRPILYLCLSATLSGCLIVPGMHMDGSTGQSNVPLPKAGEQETLIGPVEIKTITASLIVEMQRQLNNRGVSPEDPINRYYGHRLHSARELAPQGQVPYRYRLGPSDIINITVWGHPELTIPAGERLNAIAAGTVIGDDGTFYYPYAGVVKAAGLRVEELRDVLTRLLGQYIENVQLDVRVAAYRSQRTYVVGEVNEPGVRRVRDVPLTVLEAINNSGGFTEEADRRNLILTRDGETYLIDLLALYERGDLSQNILLKHGDVLNVPDRNFNKIFVLGEVEGPGSIFMDKGRMSLNEALGDVGGVKQDTSDPTQIYIFRGGRDHPELFHLDARSPDSLLLAERFPLHPRDVIYVDAAQGIRWNRVVSQIAPTVNLLNSIDALDLPPDPFNN